MENIIAYLEQYGYIVLFGALLLELIAFPIPGEVLMTYSGFLVYQHDLNWAYSIIVASAGTSIGMTISYSIGRKLGAPFFIKYGHHFHMGPAKISKISVWFNKHGNKLLIVAYFIPGLRHITGYFSGIIQIPFRLYALYAYSGAFLWVSLFITFGKILGPEWEQFHSSIKKYFFIAAVFAIAFLVGMYLYKKYKAQFHDYATRFLEISLYLMHSRKKVAILLISTAIVTFGLFLLMIGLIQDFLGNEFQDFNDITNLVIQFIFTEAWANFMLFFSLLGSRTTLIFSLLFIAFWILWKNNDRVPYFLLLVVVIGGGEIYEECLRRIFHNFSPLNQTLENLWYSFPSEQSLMTFVIYGIVVFILVRTIEKVSVRTFFPFVIFILLMLISISRMYLELELPSDILAGYVFGGVWLGFTILFFESLLLLRNLNTKDDVLKS